MEYLTRVFPGQTEFLDLKDASSADLMKRVLQVEQDFPGLQEAARRGASLNMTQLALNLSTYVNGVAKQHGETSRQIDRKSTRLNSSHSQISYAVFCLKKKKSILHKQLFST